MFYAGVSLEERMTLELYYARKYYEEEKKQNSPYAEYYLRILISDYIKVRDFAHAYIYLDEYIANQYKDYIRYQEYKDDLDICLAKIKEKIISRRSSDSTVIFILIDGWSYEIFRDRDKYEMEFLHEYVDQKGVEFENACSPGIYTSEVIRSIFIKKNVFEEDFYDINTGDKKNNLFYRYLNEKGFRIKNCGNFDLEGRRRVQKKGHYPNVNSLFWDMICDMVENDEPTFYYIHEIGLFHPPTQCGYQNYIPKKWFFTKESNLEPFFMKDDAFKDSAKYLDESMMFFFDYFPAESAKVIFSDHGGIVRDYKGIKPWQESLIHVPLLVFSRHIQPHKVKDLCSTFYLSELLYDLLNGTDIFWSKKIEFSQSSLTLMYEQNHLNILKKIWGRINNISFKAFTTLEDKYVITYAGQEYYYRLPNETTNLINDPKYQERIQYIKSKNDLRFPDFGHPKYKETRHLYFDERNQPTQFFEE